MSELVENFIHLFTESAPFLLLGLFLAGLVRQVIPEAWVKKILGKNSSVLVATLIGTPLPLCSCSVIPTAMGIRRAGASKASTASFMVATPETGPDSIGVTLALMGPIMAIARPIAAITSAISTGLLVRWWDNEETVQQGHSEQKSCCGHSHNSSAPTSISSTNSASFVQTCKRIVQYGFGKLLSDFMSWLLIGLFLAALIQTFVPSSTLTHYGSGVMAMVVVIIISIPCIFVQQLQHQLPPV